MTQTENKKIINNFESDICEHFCIYILNIIKRRCLHFQFCVNLIKKVEKQKLNIKHFYQFKKLFFSELDSFFVRTANNNDNFRFLVAEHLSLYGLTFRWYLYLSRNIEMELLTELCCR